MTMDNTFEPSTTHRKVFIVPLPSFVSHIFIKVVVTGSHTNTKEVGSAGDNKYSGLTRKVQS